MTAKVIKSLTELNTKLTSLVLDYGFNESMLKYTDFGEKKRNVERESEKIAKKITECQEELNLIINHLIG